MCIRDSMYNVAQDSDTMEVTYAAGVNPKLVFVCQNIADVNSIRPDYKMTVCLLYTSRCV